MEKDTIITLYIKGKITVSEARKRLDQLKGRELVSKIDKKKLCTQLGTAEIYLQ